MITRVLTWPFRKLTTQLDTGNDGQGIAASMLLALLVVGIILIGVAIFNYVGGWFGAFYVLLWLYVLVRTAFP